MAGQSGEGIGGDGGSGSGIVNGMAGQSGEGIGGGAGGAQAWAAAQAASPSPTARTASHS